MTQKARNAQVPTQVVLFGVDENGKPKAARFSNGQVDLAIKAAAQLKLQVLPVNDGKIAELAARLPNGRVHANGKGFIPTIRRDLYSKLLEASGQAAVAQGAPASTSASQVPGPLGKLPHNWQEIAAGHIVIIQENDPRDGWWEAIVEAATADMLSLRWRAAPRERAVARHRLSVGLMYPDANPLTTQPGSATKNGQSNHKQAGDAPPATAPGTVCPRGWDEIGPEQLVLAREDGPLGQWWEATVVNRQDDTFTLRWRDYPDLPTIVRSRRSLALLHPSDKQPNASNAH